MRLFNALLLFSTAIFLASCGDNKAKQMFTEYQAKLVKEAYQTDLKELDFKINSIKKTGEILASDSMFILKSKLNIMWYGEYTPSEDTLTFNRALIEIDKAIDVYQKTINTYIDINQEYRNHELKRKVKEYREAQLQIRDWSWAYDKYVQNPGTVLSATYHVNYSLRNPLLNIKQTHDRILYTNAYQTKFVDESAPVN